MGWVSDYLLFVRQERKWWVVPVIVFLAIVGLVAAGSSSALAPFLYPLL